MYNSNISNDCIISSFSRGLFKTQMTYVKVRTKSTRAHYILWIQKLFQTLWLRLKSWISSGLCLKFVLQLSCIIHTSKSFNVLRLTHFNSIHFISSICYKSIDILRNMCKIKYQNDTRKLILIFYIVYTIELVFFC